MSHRTHRFDAWHLLAEPTFGAILAPAEGEALAELARREETARDELRRARDAEAPTPVGVAPRADADDDAATEGRSADGDDTTTKARRAPSTTTRRLTMKVTTTKNTRMSSGCRQTETSACVAS